VTDQRLRVLVVADREDDHLMIAGLLSEINRDRFAVTRSSSCEEAIELGSRDHDLWLIAHRPDEGKFLDLLHASSTGASPIPTIVLLPENHPELDLSEVTEGAVDHLTREQIDKRLLERSIRYTVERAKALTALKAGETKYRQIVETATEGIWIIDNQATITYCNQRLAEMFGHTVDSLLGRCVLDFADEHNRAIAAKNCKRLREGIVEQIEIRFTREDGDELWALVSSNPMRDADGEFIGALAMVANITERKRAEEQLKRSEERFRALIEHASEMVAVIDANGDVCYVTPSVLQLLGYEADEWVGKNFFEFIDPAELPAVAEALHTGVDHRDAADPMELRVKHKNGSWRVLEVSDTNLLANDAVKGIVINARDITERKWAEQERERLAAIVDSSHDAIVSLTLDGRITSWNASAERIYGYTATEAIGRHLSFIIPSERVDESGRILESLERGERIEQLETVRVRKDGRRIEVSISTSPINEADGRMVGGSTIARDITARKLVEQELRNSEERYRDLVENAHDIIYSHDLDGNYTSVNKACELITGYTREEAIGRNLAELVAPECLADARRMLATKLAGVEETVYDLEIVAKDGHRISVEVNSRLVYQDGVPMGVQGIARDVTERKQLEQQLRQSQKMEAVGLLAGGVAHDFNNLLTVITGYSQLAMMKLQTDDPLRRHIEQIEKAGERAASLTRQLLAFSRKQVLQPKILDLNSVVLEMERMLRRLIGEHIELRTVLEPAPGGLKADPGQIEQVIMNLAVNARDAMPHGGRLTLEIANVELDDEYATHHIEVAPGPYVMLSVSDTGTGIDDETQARIFEPFFTTKELGKGSGLGLSTVYGIVQQSGGHISVHSQVGVGTTFKIYLPRIVADAHSHRAGAETQEPFRGSETILLAEDDETVRGLVRRVLTGYGYKVLEAADGDSALLICREHPEPIAMLLTDVIMPETSGPQLANKLSQLRPDIKVLYMSGYTDDSIVHHGGLESGINFLQKPFTPAVLMHKIRQVLMSE
jgi:PAS domain S-box-containing protein